MKKIGVLKVRNSRKIYIPLYFMIIVLLIVIIYIKISERPLDDIAFKFAMAFIIAFLIATELHRLGNSYEITDSSIILKHGYFTTISKRIEYGAISDIDVKQNLWQRIFLYGNIQIFKFSEKSVIRNINKPFIFVDFLSKKMSGLPKLGMVRSTK